MHNVVLQEHLDQLENTYEASLKDAYITGNIKKVFEKADFRGARLEDIKITDAVFTECDFSEATITADITNAKFIRCNFEFAHFRHSNIYDSAFIDNKCMQTHFTHTSIRQTELSKNDFTIASMDDVIMSEISVKEPNMYEHTIMFGFPGATREELNKMKENCINELSGAAEMQIEKKTDNQWDMAERIFNKTYLTLFLPEEQEYAYMNTSEQVIGEIFDDLSVGRVERHLERVKNTIGEYRAILEDISFEDAALKDIYTKKIVEVEELLSNLENFSIHTEVSQNNSNDNSWNNAIEEVMETIEAPEPDYDMEM